MKEKVNVKGLSTVFFDLQEGRKREDVERRPHQVGVDLEVTIDWGDLKSRH